MVGLFFFMSRVRASRGVGPCHDHLACTASHLGVLPERIPRRPLLLKPGFSEALCLPLSTTNCVCAFPFVHTASDTFGKQRRWRKSLRTRFTILFFCLNHSFLTANPRCRLCSSLLCFCCISSTFQLFIGPCRHGSRRRSCRCCCLQRLQLRPSTTQCRCPTRRRYAASCARRQTRRRICWKKQHFHPGTHGRTCCFLPRCRRTSWRSSQIWGCTGKLSSRKLGSTMTAAKPSTPGLSRASCASRPRW